MAICSSSTRKVYCVLVTYGPDVKLLRVILRRISIQVTNIVLVDNFYDDRTRELVLSLRDTFKNLIVIPLYNNEGLANALNIGCRAAIDGCATHILLLDQDSVPHKKLVVNLVSADDAIPDECILGSSLYDRMTKRAFPFYALGRVGVTKKVPSEFGEVTPCSYVLSSGMFFSVGVYSTCGPFRDDWFIDLLDVEWCFRAFSFGIKIYGVPKAAMAHSIGEGGKKFFSKTIYYHSPIRDYYFFRNVLYMIGLRYVPTRWKVGAICKLFFSFFAYLVLLDNRVVRFKFMFRGLCHGFSNVGKNFKWMRGSRKNV